MRTQERIEKAIKDADTVASNQLYDIPTRQRADAILCALKWVLELPEGTTYGEDDE